MQHWRHHIRQSQFLRAQLSRRSSNRRVSIVMPKKIMPKKMKTVATLESTDCRWPIGDPREADFHFCGEAKLPGRPYCELHWRVAFQPARPRSAPPAIIPPARRAA